MNWDDLRYVLAVGRRRTLTAAGSDLKVDATTVGRRVLAIEESLGTRLFERTSTGFSPTHTGAVAVARAEEIELQALALEHDVEGSDLRAEGPVRIAALDMLMDEIIIPHLPRLLSKHPGLELTLVSDMRVFDLARREADIGIRNEKPTHPNLVSRRLGIMAAAFYTATDFEIGAVPRLVGLPRDLEEHPFNKAIVDRFPDGFIVARANTEGHMAELVRAGVGIGLLDCFVGDRDPGLERVFPTSLSRVEFWAVVHVDMRRTMRVRVVMDFLTDLFANEADRLEGRGAA